MTESQGATANSKSPAGSRKLAGSKFRAELPDQGPNFGGVSREIQAVDGQGDSQSDSLGGVVDPRLALLIEVWPALAADVKGEIVRLARYAVDDVTLAVAR